MALPLQVVALLCVYFGVKNMHKYIAACVFLLRLVGHCRVGLRSAHCNWAAADLSRRHSDWVKRHTIRTWWFNAARDMRAHVRGHMQDAAQRAAAEVAAEKDRDIAALRAQLLEARRALAAEKAAREGLHQDMKRSFMRGVCALNMEAMQVRPPSSSTCPACGG